MQQSLDRPLPEPITPEARPYWEGLRNDKLMLPTCAKCGPFFSPRVLCPPCHSRDISWIEASGKATLYSFEIAHQALNPGFKVPPPYILALVELDEGPRLLTNLVDVEPDPAALKCDMRLEVVFERLTDAITIPQFRPAGAKASEGGA